MWVGVVSSQSYHLSYYQRNACYDCRAGFRATSRPTSDTLDPASDRGTKPSLVLQGLRPAFDPGELLPRERHFSSLGGVRHRRRQTRSSYVERSDECVTAILVSLAPCTLGSERVSEVADGLDRRDAPSEGNSVGQRSTAQGRGRVEEDLEAALGPQLVSVLRPGARGSDELDLVGEVHEHQRRFGVVEDAARGAGGSLSDGSLRRSRGLSLWPVLHIRYSSMHGHKRWEAELACLAKPNEEREP